MGKNRRESRDKRASSSVSAPSVGREIVQRPRAAEFQFSSTVSKWAKERLASGAYVVDKAPRTDGQRREAYMLKASRYTPPLPQGIVDKVIPSRVVSHVPTPTASTVALSPSSAVLESGKTVARAKGEAKPALSVSKQACLRAGRPSDNKGNGGGRPFVPWCQKGKK